jgi:hypothetical protein
VAELSTHVLHVLEAKQCFVQLTWLPEHLGRSSRYDVNRLKSYAIGILSYALLKESVYLGILLLRDYSTDIYRRADINGTLVAIKVPGHIAILAEENDIWTMQNEQLVQTIPSFPVRGIIRKGALVVHSDLYTVRK